MRSASASAFVSTSSDGTTWSDFQSISGKFILRRAAFGNGLFVGVGDRGRRAYSRDGLHWDDVPGVKPLDTLIDVAFGNGVFVGVGLHGLRRSTRDGVTWSEPVRGREGEHLNAIVWADDRFVAVAPGATFLSPDGQAWERRAEHRRAPDLLSRPGHVPRRPLEGPAPPQHRRRPLARGPEVPATRRGRRLRRPRPRTP